MTQDMHQRARELSMTGRIEDIAGEDRHWLESHLADCTQCSGFAASLDNAIAAVRLPAVMADAALVRSTQIRVRGRALQIHANRAADLPAAARALAPVLVGEPVVDVETRRLSIRVDTGTEIVEAA